MGFNRRKGYTKKGRKKREDPEFNRPILLVGNVAVTRNLFCLVEERLEALGWNWSELARQSGYSRAHIHSTCRGPTMNMGIFMVLMNSLGLKWEDNCSLEYPVPSERQRTSSGAAL